MSCSYRSRSVVIVYLATTIHARNTSLDIAAELITMQGPILDFLPHPLLYPSRPISPLTSIAPQTPSALARPAHIHPAAPHTLPAAAEVAEEPHTLLVPAAGTHRHSPLGILVEEVPHTHHRHTRSAAAGADRTASVVDTRVAALGHTSLEGVGRLACPEVGVVRLAR